VSARLLNVSSAPVIVCFGNFNVCGSKVFDELEFSVKKEKKPII
jgi:hypothetical protein